MSQTMYKAIIVPPDICRSCLCRKTLLWLRYGKKAKAPDALTSGASGYSSFFPGSCGCGRICIVSPADDLQITGQSVPLAFRFKNARNIFVPHSEQKQVTNRSGTCRVPALFQRGGCKAHNARLADPQDGMAFLAHLLHPHLRPDPTSK